MIQANLHHTQLPFAAVPSTCPPGTSLVGAACTPCAGNTTSPGGDPSAAVCRTCPDKQVPSADKSACLPEDLLGLMDSDYDQISAGLAGVTLEWQHEDSADIALFGACCGAGGVGVGGGGGVGWGKVMCAAYELWCGPAQHALHC